MALETYECQSCGDEFKASRTRWPRTTATAVRAARPKGKDS